MDGSHQEPTQSSTMSSRFKSVYESLPSPVPAGIEIIRHLLVSPSTLFEAPLSRPVIERLQWIKPSLEDERESYLYFNNMVDHGASGRVHDLRMGLIHAGSSSWAFCKAEEVEYKVDEDCVDPDGLCEIFCRVAVWKTKEDLDNEPVHSKEKVALILKLESIVSPLDLNKDPIDQVSWKYFDLQDLTTPGLDTRPWFETAIKAAAHRPLQITESERLGEEDEDYWAGFSSSRSDGSSLTSGSDSGLKPSSDYTIPIDPILVARIRNTPLYRSKAPSVSSMTNSDQIEPGTPGLGNHGPIDLRARLSRTPLYKRAPSIDDTPPILPEPNKDIDVDRLLEAAHIVNLPPKTTSLRTQHINPNLESSSSLPKEDLQEKLADSLRATFHLYRLCLENSAHSDSLPSSSSQLSPGESFIALAHRVVLQESQNSLHH
ncbi:hypothetical protein Pst134EA_021408 [Puccinia striiformis f. sp. tritici]|uniref:hypothetical protein n=1 Tax=Puccinia striiformis f. sp. tritici TaxID=168172 RepID=UPI002007B4D8|nr:hypothetical protein Pst134EA_021408 [Puccinia striiformis f. sp. tritici]KAH9457534.1 hypothetical protein Pst134EA_021408 [Puccinia striiformis f. sp. tritici]